MIGTAHSYSEPSGSSSTPFRPCPAPAHSSLENILTANLIAINATLEPTEEWAARTGGASAVGVSPSIDGADNGIRIKSNSNRGVVVRDIVYEDASVRYTKNPIFMDTNCSLAGADHGKIPRFKSGARVTLEGFITARPLGMHLGAVSGPSVNLFTTPGNSAGELPRG